jgi:hypothetical protein
MFKISEKANHNYLAQVVRLDNIVPHPNADRLQIASIQGNSVIVSLDAKEGDVYVYFPLECAINKEFLSWSNSFSDKTLNADKQAVGFFGKQCRVRAVKLRSVPSMGYALPFDKFCNWLEEKTGKSVEFKEDLIGKEFDSYGDILVCEKYVNPVTIKNQNKANNKKQGRKAIESKLISGQFSFHIDTPNLRKLVSQISPEDYISITRKYHGTSAVISKVLCRKKLNWAEKLLKKLGVNVVDTEYDMVYSSRRVIKNGDIRGDSAVHYYSHDIWGDAAKVLESTLEPGISLYLEIVGYVGESYIQSGYDYGFQPGKFDTYVYRITHTDPDGNVFEYSPAQVKEYCIRKGINSVPEFYYGKAKDLFDISTKEHWHENLLDKLCENYLEKYCDDCSGKIPDEGIVLRVDKPNEICVFKLKSFAFLEMETKQLDKEDFVDIESSDV